MEKGKSDIVLSCESSIKVVNEFLQKNKSIKFNKNKHKFSFYEISESNEKKIKNFVEKENKKIGKENKKKESENKIIEIFYKSQIGKPTGICSEEFQRIRKKHKEIYSEVLSGIIAKKTTKQMKRKLRKELSIKIK